MEYDFVLTEPSDRLVIHIKTLDQGEAFFDATLTMHREPWSSANLTRALVRQPWLTARIITAIHWEGLRLWWKNVPVYTHPARKGAS